LSKKIAIRTDTNEIIATGHVMRCLTIAGELRTLGCEVIFVSSDEMIRPYTDHDGFDVHILDSDYSDKEAETDNLISFLKKENINTLFVDSYSVTEKYFLDLKNAGMHVMYMDDLCKCAYPVDAVVNYCPAAVSLGYEIIYSKETKLYLGPAFIPLREQFRQGLRSTGDGLMITAGGSDSLGLADIMIEGILDDRGLGYSDCIPGRIHLLAGRYYEPGDAVKKAVKDGSVILHQSVDNVAQIMKDCRAAISSAGTTLFELSAVGVVTASYVFVDNQMTDAMYFDREGLMPYIGDFRVSSGRCMERIIDFLYDINGMSATERKAKSNALTELIDGEGAGRIAKALMEL